MVNDISNKSSKKNSKTRSLLFIFGRKTLNMKSLYLLLAFSLSILSFAHSASFEGYIVTKDGIRLTGLIGDLNQNLNAVSINFINDFGDSYYLAPELIKGFVFQQDTTIVAFESKFDPIQERWEFMQVIDKGPGINLYSVVSDRSIERGIFEEGSTSFFKAKDYYFELKGKLPEKVQRMGFKKQVSELIRRKAPKLADSIGSRNYRYRDIINIVTEYNTIVKNRKKFL